MSQQATQSPKQEIKSTINRLKEDGIYQGFPKGKKIPNFSLSEQEKMEIYDLLKDNEFVIVNFFRGDWCGYCKSELDDLKEINVVVNSLNAKVVGIAPQSQETLNKLQAEMELPFELYADPDLAIAKMFNLVWEVPENLQEIYMEEFDLNIPKLNANNSWHLPVPATYIVNKEGAVVAKFEDLNYSERIAPEKILEILRLHQ